MPTANSQQPTANSQQPTANSQQPTANSQQEILIAQQQFLNNLDATLWDSANKLRKNVDAANYKHIVLGLIFLKYISDSFTKHRQQLQIQFADPQSPYYLDPAFYSEQAIQKELEDRDYYTKDNIFYVPQPARWEQINQAMRSQIGAELWEGYKFKGVANLIDNAFDCLERENPRLKNVLERISRYEIPEADLISLVELFTNIRFNDSSILTLSSKDILGHIYEYFLGQFALAEGKKGGQYFTPKSIVTLIVEMLEPYAGRVYDPAMGAGGFFVQTERFIQAHQGNINNTSIFGQESNPTTYKLAVMNMAIRGIECDFEKEDTLKNPKHIDKKMDFIMANPPFNANEWWSESLTDDPRWQYGLPPQSNANFAWLQHMIYHLSPKGKMALLLANGSMSSQTNNEGEIRKNVLKADLVEAMIALPNQLFTNTPIPACIWLLNKAKARKGEVLFIDARQIGYMKDRVLRDFTAEDIAKVADTYHNWQKSKDYQDIPAFCKSATLADIEKNDWILTPGRYVGTAEQEDDGVPFAEKMQNLTACLKEQFKQSAELEAKIRENLKGLGYE